MDGTLTRHDHFGKASNVFEKFSLSSGFSETSQNDVALMKGTTSTV
jgi:hypothetical protein